MNSSAAKRSWQQGNMWLGMGVRAWGRLLKNQGLRIAPSHLPQAMVLSACSLGNSFLGLVERAIFGRTIARSVVPLDPIFILGHWRTGSTLLHELMSLDPNNRCPTTYESLSPHHFLLTQSMARRWGTFLLPRQRPMDHVRVGFDRPQEDEIALCNLGVPSPFLVTAFPKSGPVYDAYVCMDSLAPKKKNAWQDQHRRFVRRLQVSRPGRVVLKSPQHSFRIPTILETYPQAKFIYLVRDPFEVYSSTIHFWQKMFGACGLQGTEELNYPSGVAGYVLDNFRRMHERVEGTRALVPQDRWATVRYETLTADPKTTIEGIYTALELGPITGFADELDRAAQLSRKFKRNHFCLDPELREQVVKNWAGYFDQHGYDRSIA